MLYENVKPPHRINWLIGKLYGPLPSCWSISDKPPADTDKMHSRGILLIINVIFYYKMVQKYSKVNFF